MVASGSDPQSSADSSSPVGVRSLVGEAMNEIGRRIAGAILADATIADAIAEGGGLIADHLARTGAASIRDAPPLPTAQEARLVELWRVATQRLLVVEGIRGKIAESELMRIVLVILTRDRTLLGDEPLRFA